MTQFDAHGQTAFEVRGRILVFRPHSGGNREEVERMVDKIHEVLPRFAGKSWATMVIIDTPMLMTHDAESKAQTANLKMLELGLVGHAIVMPDSPARLLIERVMSRIYGDSKIRVGSFDNEAEAERWLLELIEKSAG
jgi:hypothetical protein